MQQGGRHFIAANGRRSSSTHGKATRSRLLASKRRVTKPPCPSGLSECQGKYRLVSSEAASQHIVQQDNQPSVLGGVCQLAKRVRLSRNRLLVMPHNLSQNPGIFPTTKASKGEIRT